MLCSFLSIFCLFQARIKILLVAIKKQRLRSKIQTVYFLK
jgi:hypothetical protein